MATHSTLPYITHLHQKLQAGIDKLALNLSQSIRANSSFSADRHRRRNGSFRQIPVPCGNHAACFFRREVGKGLIAVHAVLDQLANLLIQARTANPKLRTVIRGDKEADYGLAEDVMDILQKTEITRFSLVTDLSHSVKEQ